MLETSEYVKIFISLLVIIDPLAAIPLFASLTSHYTQNDRTRTARTACTVVFTVFVATVLAGETILSSFGISIGSFKIGGGILLLLMAIEMMNAQQIPSKHTPEEDREAEDRLTIGVVPVGIPLLAGPGSISTLIIFSERSDHPGHKAAIILMCAAVVLLTWLALTASKRIAAVMGRTGINIAIRIMGLLLAAIAVEFIAAGAFDLFRTFSRQ